ncbi:MAG: hypothetical protein ACR2GA_07065 [Chloroflexota bacterium]
MTYEDERVVANDDPTVPERVVERRVEEPTRVVESAPATRYVHSDDPVGNVMAASQLIQTIVWAVVVLVLLVVALLALHVYAHLF